MRAFHKETPPWDGTLFIVTLPRRRINPPARSLCNSFSVRRIQIDVLREQFVGDARLLLILAPIQRTRELFNPRIYFLPVFASVL